jgi:hypothetical protein
MAARKKNKGNTLEIVKLHIDAQTRLADLAEDAQALRRAGKIRGAKRLEAQMCEIRSKLQSLERIEPVRVERPR